MTRDITTEYHGSVILLRPLTEAGQEWLMQNLGGDPLYFGNAVACEPRCVSAILDGARNDGLNVD